MTTREGGSLKQTSNVHILSLIWIFSTFETLTLNMSQLYYSFLIKVIFSKGVSLLLNIKKHFIVSKY